MPDTGGSRQVLDGDVSTGAAATSVELVPVAQALHYVSKQPLPRPDAGFVTQLIAAAALAPETGPLRRGTLADARTAYGAGPQERRGVARRTRQII
ncbi:hypothetical protein I6F35_16285 [Bradyrhizobium sp. BRP22]|uniref:hypothetical protein n=1 Tax=Bradyrhizobium sp. BRP22 TaxID=2793821 RepID=UPI001CD3A404|nr:hypothetical protein [Bradyrhizobium sp. BRP22]MCA1454768.1 hypothetical protein [Bradyrhizobium sp. BRP22]